MEKLRKKSNAQRNVQYHARYIANVLPEVDTLLQIAEEASELAQAAAKLARVIRGVNPTPLTEEEARDTLEEEYSDLNNALSVYNMQHKIATPGHDDRRMDKMRRWHDRIRGARTLKHAASDQADNTEFDFN